MAGASVADGAAEMEQNRVAGRLLPGGLAEVDNEDGSKTLLRFVGVDGQSMKFEPVENDGHEMTLRGSSVAERHVSDVQGAGSTPAPATEDRNHEN